MIDGALLGQRVGVLVERPDGGGEAPASRVVGDAVRDALGRAEIGAEQHQKRRLHARPRPEPDS